MAKTITDKLKKFKSSLNGVQKFKSLKDAIEENKKTLDKLHENAVHHIKSTIRVK